MPLLSLLLRGMGGTRAAALTVTALVTSAFCYVTVASAVETYALTATLSAAGMTAALLLSGWREAGVIGGLAGALSGLNNLPAAAFAILTGQLAAGDHARLRWRAILIAGAIAVLLSLAPLAANVLLLHSRAEGNVLNKWASFRHFSDAPMIRDYLATVTSFAFVSPRAVLRCRYLVGDLAFYARAPLRLAAVIGWWILLCGGTALGLAGRGARAVTIAALATIAAMLLFYLYFAPQPAELYGVQAMPAIALLVLPVAMAGRWGWVAPAVLAILSAAVNVPVLPASPVNDFAAVCPPPLPVDGGL